MVAPIYQLRPLTVEPVVDRRAKDQHRDDQRLPFVYGSSRRKAKAPPRSQLIFPFVVPYGPLTSE